MQGLISGLAGAGGAANTAGSYYQNALGQLINSTGSPAASTFGAEEIAGLQPGFKQQDQNLIGTENALGIANSGAAKANLTDLAAGQSSAEAQGIAPLYSQAEQQYGNILGQEPGAQNQAYQGAINQFLQSISDAGSLAATAFGGGGGGAGADLASLGIGGGSGGSTAYSGTNSGNNSGSSDPYSAYG